MGLFGSSGYPVTTVNDDLRSHVKRATETIIPTTDPGALDTGDTRFDSLPRALRSNRHGSCAV